MNVRSCMVAALVAATAATAGAQRLSAPLGEAPGLRLTESCPTQDAPTSAIIDGTDAFRAASVAAINNRSLDPALLYALWLPVSARETGLLVFDYVDRFQNVSEIVQALNADPALAARGFARAFPNGYGCFSPSPPPGFVQVAEYFNPELNHYQLAVGDSERGELASSGWVLTGESFRALAQGYCYSATMVFRFSRSFAARRGSSFLTLDPAECGQVRKHNPAWRPRDVPFYAIAAQNGSCEVGLGSYAVLPVYRLYNKREMFNDMNHRYTTSAAAYEQMQAAGWSGEGIAFCAAGT